MKATRRFACWCWSIALSMIAGLGAAHAGGLVFNITESLPRGLWQTEHRPAPIERGVVAMVTPPDNPAMNQLREWGYGREPLLKPIAAVPGDVVDVTPEGVRINGVLLENTAQLAEDGEHHLLPRMPAGRYVVAPGTVWLVSDYNPLSLDSRYYGAVPVANIGPRARPVWVHQGAPSAG